MGPASVAEDAGATGSANSVEKTGDCGDTGESRNASENAARSDGCSNVARPPTADLLPAIEATIAALDAGEIEAARAGLHALAAALRPHVTSGANKAFGPT